MELQGQRRSTTLGLTVAPDVLDAVAGQGRLVRRFSWETVEPSLIRDLLAATYNANKQTDDAAEVLALKDEILRQNAVRVLGRPPNVRHNDAIVDVLRDIWLPTVRSEVLGTFVEDVQLGLAGKDRGERPLTKAERLAFLRGRRRTMNFKLQLRRFFVLEHRALMPVETQSVGGAPRTVGPIELHGAAAVDHRAPFDCQRDVWRALTALEAAKGERSGLIVLPTGAGKTYTTVHWLLERMSARPELRVLWLADRQELVDQAVRTFEDLATTMPVGFSRRLRAVHGNANPASSIADPDLDIAIVTRQSTLSSFEGMGRKRIAGLLTRPTVVVVDEAHHAVAPTYERLLAEIAEADDVMLVGLTATPWPSGYGAVARLRERFKVSLGEVSIGELIALDVLARPVFHTVETDLSLSLDPVELKQAVGRDLPPSVLRRLDQVGRNELIYQAWWKDREQWGKTLLFAVDIYHADTLGELFAERGAPVDVLHSEIGEPASDVLARFRAAKGPTVLVSVGMLTEGVDVPDARTAFLARPTSSRILLRQMIGRVLRGPAAGGDAIAHVVDVHDRWDDDLEVLSPVEIPGIPWPPKPDRDVHLPSVRDELTGELIPEDLLLRIERQINERIKGTKIAFGLTASMLTGFYQLDLLSVPVFEHTAESWRELIEATLAARALCVRYPIDLFADLPVPRPTPYDVRLVIEFVESQRVEPPFRAVRTSLSVRAVAAALIDAGPMTQDDRRDWLRQQYQATLAILAFPSYRHFHEAVDREVLALTEGKPPFDPENVAPGQTSTEKPKLRNQADREIEPLLKSTAARGRAILAGEEEYAGRLNAVDLPSVEWSRKPRKGSWAYWTPRIRGKSKGRTFISVNSALRAPKSQVSDELLQFLLWHELCHHLTPNQGHDAEFRRLEALWPDAQHYDYVLDDLDPGP